jgi:hypothetical protein
MQVAQAVSLSGPAPQAVFGFFGIILGGLPLTGSVRPQTPNPGQMQEHA